MLGELETLIGVVEEKERQAAAEAAAAHAAALAAAELAKLEADAGCRPRRKNR